MSAAATGPLGHSCSSSPERRAGWERKRRARAEELLRTEGRYLEQLEGVATYFVVTLKAKGILKPDIHKILFGPWESICSASRTLLFHLTRGHFALGLESFCHQLVFYIHYAENLEAAQNILKKLVKKNKAFSRFKKLQESRPELKGCRLEELLPLPLQRLHQYRHLLQDLVEHTPPESSGFDQLQGSLKSVLEVLHRVQEIARVHENLLMMRQIQKQLKGRKTQVLAPALFPTKKVTIDVLRSGGLCQMAPESDGGYQRASSLWQPTLSEGRVSQLDSAGNSMCALGSCLAVCQPADISPTLLWTSNSKHNPNTTLSSVWFPVPSIQRSRILGIALLLRGCCLHTYRAYRQGALPWDSLLSNSHVTQRDGSDLRFYTNYFSYPWILHSGM